MKHRLIFVLVLLPIFAFAAEEETLHLSVSAEVLVFDRVSASNLLAEWAEGKGGYFTWKSEESVRLRVPDGEVAGFREYIDEIGEATLGYRQSTVDVREELLRRRSALEAREEILRRNLFYLDSSDVEGTLELETEIRRLMNEIDEHRGALRKLEHDRGMATIEVALSVRMQSLPDARPSRFEWVNTMDAYAFLGIWMGGNPAGFMPPPIPVPAGFAEVDRTPDFMAVSPEGVRLRIRRVKNYPEQTVDFWSETLEKHLQDRGYVPVPDNRGHDWGGGRGDFDSRLWAIPVGTEDYLYLTGVRESGNELELLEVAGPAEYVMKYLPD